MVTTGMHGALAGAGNWGAIDKAGLQSTPEVVNDALGPIPRTSMEKNLEPESELLHPQQRLHCLRTTSNSAKREQSSLLGPPQTWPMLFRRSHLA